MRYIISDIHGCYKEYKELLKKIHFTETDELYVLGDAMDRGPEPIKVIRDIMMQPNVIYVLGNHDFTMWYLMKKLLVEVTEQNFDNGLSEEDIQDLAAWMMDGGEVTLQQFHALHDREEQQDILEYLEDAPVYEILEDSERKFILVHAGICHFQEDKDLDEYEFADFISGRPDYSKRYYTDQTTYVVTGHTPTMYIRPDQKPEVFQGNGHIAIDCGCVFGGNLAAYCVETGEITYVKANSYSTKR